MIRESHELLIDLWSRVRPHIAPKERIETADIFARVFDEFGHLDEDILDEDMDPALRAAIRGVLDTFDLDEDETIDDYE